MLSDRVQAQLDKGLGALNMFFEVGEAQSGIAKVLDRSELYDFLLTISTTVFDSHVTKLIKYSSAYYYMNDVADRTAIIQKPVTFDLLSVQEEATLLTAASQANLDPTYIRAKQINFARKDLFGKTNELQMTEDSLIMNPFVGVSSDTILGNYNAGLVTEVDAIIAVNISNFIVRAYAENKEFFSGTYEQKRAILEEYANEIADDGGIVTIPASAKTGGI